MPQTFFKDFTRAEFDPADFEKRYIEFARVLGFVCRRVNKPVVAANSIQAISWHVMLDGEWYSHYATEFHAAMEYIRYMGFTDQMHIALDAIGAGDVEVPPYRNT